MVDEGERSVKGRCNIGVVVVHGVADTEQGNNLKTLVAALQRRSASGPCLKPKDHAEVRELGEEKPPQPYHFRRAIRGEQPITIAEVYWADTTRVEAGKPAALRAAFGIVFEAHYFIKALVRTNAGWPAALYAWLLHAAAFLIRVPIAGFNIVLLSVAAVYLSGQAVARLADHPDASIMSVQTAVILVCIAVLYLSWRSFRKSRDRADIAGMEVSIGAVAASLAATAIVGTLVARGTVPDAQAVEHYSGVIFVGLIWVWRVFCALILAAFVLAIAMSLFPGRASRRSLWAALALVVLQASLWVLFISIPGVLLLGLAKVGGVPTGQIELVKYGFAFNAIGIAATGVIGWFVWARRAKVAKTAGAPQSSDASQREQLLKQTARKVPRLIMNWKLVAALVAFGLFNATLNLSNLEYAPSAQEGAAIPLLIAAGISVIAGLLYWLIDSKAAVNVIHIARDLIDHNYDPKTRLAFMLVPKGKRQILHFPRRERLLLRVKAAVRYLVEKDGCDAIVFAAHSQGTIIVFEYFREFLKGNADTFHKSAAVTFGSPLNHLYEYYFHDYDALGAMLIAQKRHVETWINLYRIDDQIGNRIGDPEGWVADRAMEAGGHTNYWKEDEVADAILSSIETLRATLRSHHSG